jgi:hypothetical protein
MGQCSEYLQSCSRFRQLHRVLIVAKWRCLYRPQRSGALAAEKFVRCEVSAVAACLISGCGHFSAPLPFCKPISPTTKAAIG